MDLATHAIAGMLMARSRAGWVGRRDVAVVAVTASLLPDVDMLAALLDPTRAALERHTLTHSLLALPVMAATLAFAARLLGARLAFGTAFTLAIFGIAGHLALDLVNAYGVALLHPFSDRRFELPLLFVLDPVLTPALAALLGASLWATRRRRRQAALARLAIVAAVLYLGVALHLRERAEAVAVAAAGSAGGMLVPEPLAPWRWRFIAPLAEGYAQVLIDPVTPSAVPLPLVASQAGDPRVAAIRAAGLLETLDPFLRAPVWTVDGDRVAVHDLRFRFALLGNEWDPFGFAFDLADGAPKPVEATVAERVDRILATLGAIATGPGPARAAPR